MLASLPHQAQQNAVVHYSCKALAGRPRRPSRLLQAQQPRERAAPVRQHLHLWEQCRDGQQHTRCEHAKWIHLHALHRYICSHKNGRVWALLQQLTPLLQSRSSTNSSR
jgi:hypothetical protein